MICIPRIIVKKYVGQFIPVIIISVIWIYNNHVKYIWIKKMVSQFDSGEIYLDQKDGIPV